MWNRVYLPHAKIANAVGFRFRSLDDTVKDMVTGLVDVGGVVYHEAA
jgi:hypothetical protein